MALIPQTASSSLVWPDSPPRWKFDVFLSFRGDDTRRGFISHLYNKLQFWQVYKTFIDDQELEIGAEISSELFLAIENSHLAIVVLSPNYASSTWCLDELAKIIEFMKARDKRILPVFHNVDPSDVRHQRNSFAEAFAKHEVKFSNDPQKVKRWREALTKVANLSGWDIQNYKSENELIEVIVRSVREKLSPTVTLSSYGEKLVGIDSSLKEMVSLLFLEEKDVQFIGIWGMGGLGKTTLAKLLYDKISYHFDVAKFVDVTTSDGRLVDLQKQILSPIVKENIGNKHEGSFFIRKRMSNKKVLLVVDDVDSSELLEYLAGHKSWFGEGSRIIVTTRDKRLLTEHRIHLSFELLGLDNSEALKLFSHKAFEKDQPEEGFVELSKCFVDYAKGLPLAIVTLGSSLYQRNLDEWNSALDSLKRIPNPRILDTLKLSYDALDYWQREIFLDIAFLYTGMEKGHIIELLECCYRSNFLIVVNVLIEKSLITIDRDNNVGMHGLIQEMAKEIVRQETQESREEPGLRSRLCDRDDILHVFTRNTGTEAIKGISLCLPRLEEADSNWNWDCFSKMHKLMFLKIHNLKINSGPRFLPNILKILIWNRYPSKSLPVNFRPNLLAELQIRRSKLVQLWDGRQDLPNLKNMDLGLSKNLQKTPDFTSMPNLEVLYLDRCEGLVEVHPSIAVLKKLKMLMLSACKNLKSFPREIEMDSLESLDLSSCSKVKIPEFGENMKNLSNLRIPGTATEELPVSIEHLVGLKELFMYDSKSLQSLPGTAISKLKSLKVLSIGRCPKLKTFVENTEETKYLKPSIRRKLYSLLRKKSPEPLCLALPSPLALPSLWWLNLSDCNLCQGVIPDDIGYCLPSLDRLDLGGNNFVTLPASIKCLSKLSLIDLSRCKRLEELPDLPSNSELRVWADYCASLKKLSEPSQQGTFNTLECFELRTVNCSGLIDKEGLNNGIFSMLRRLAAQGFSPPSSPSDDPPFGIVSPGSKISEWFDIRSEGDSLTVELPQDRESCRSEWMGVLFCVVFAIQEEPPHTLDYDDIFISCLSPAEIYSLCFPYIRHVMGDHLWVFFMPRAEIQNPTNCSVRFSSFNGNGDSPCSNWVKRCGARLLYEQDLKNLLNTAATQILKRSREDCDSEEEAEAEAREDPGGSSNKESLFKRIKGMIA